MNWQKRFDREDPNKEIEDKILRIHDKHKDFGYRRMCGELRKQGYTVNKKRVKESCRNSSCRLHNSPDEQRIKEKLGWMSPVEYRLSFTA